MSTLIRTPEDLARQLVKVLDVLMVVDDHFTAEARMNAALHMAQTVRPAPLAAAVATSKGELHNLIRELEEDARS